MIRFELFFGLLTLALWIYALVDVISSDDGAVRHLPKLGWLLIVLFFPLAGSIAWLVAGRPDRVAGTPAHERAMPQFPEYDRPGRAAATDAESDEAFLRQVRARAEEQRLRYRASRREEPGPNHDEPRSEPPS